MKRHLTLAWHYVRLAVMHEVQYRINFFVQIIEAVIALGTALVVLALVYAHTDQLGGWYHDELQALLGIFTIMMAILRMSIQPNIERLIGDIQQGSFDFVLIKPIDAQWQVSIRELRIWQSVDIMAGFIVLGHALWHLGTRVTMQHALFFGITLVNGILLIYAVWMLISCIAFWVIRIDNIFELFDNVASAGRLPVGVYPPWVRIILTYIVPVAFAVTVPAEAITARLDMPRVIVQTAVTGVFLVVLRIIWQRALVRYSGASA
ncbi:MAG: ABC transporter permease [Roseiflexaceae bacterium]